MHHLSCPARPRSLEITSRTLAAVMCDAEDPCPVNTAYESRSFCTTSSRVTTRPLCFWIFLSNLASFRWHKSTSVAKWTILPSFCAFSITFRLLLTFDSCHAGNLFLLCPFFVIRGLRIWGLHCQVQRNRFVHKIVITHRVEHFSTRWYSSSLFWVSGFALSCRFVSLAHLWMHIQFYICSAGDDC